MIVYLFTGLPYIRLIPKVTAVSGEVLHLKCPVAGYPIEEIHWERGTCLSFCPLIVCVCTETNNFTRNSNWISIRWIFFSFFCVCFHLHNTWTSFKWFGWPTNWPHSALVLQLCPFHEWSIQFFEMALNVKHLQINTNEQWQEQTLFSININTIFVWNSWFLCSSYAVLVPTLFFSIFLSFFFFFNHCIKFV